MKLHSLFKESPLRGDPGSGLTTVLGNKTTSIWGWSQLPDTGFRDGNMAEPLPESQHPTTRPWGTAAGFSFPWSDLQPYKACVRIKPTAQISSCKMYFNFKGPEQPRIWWGHREEGLVPDKMHRFLLFHQAKPSTSGPWPAEHAKWWQQSEKRDRKTLKAGEKKNKNK